MKSFSELLNKKSYKVKTLDEKTIFSIAKNIIKKEFGEIGCENIFPEKIIKKTLFLRVLGSLWESEVWLRRGDLINEINQEANLNIINKIKFD